MLYSIPHYTTLYHTIPSHCKTNKQTNEQIRQVKRIESMSKSPVLNHFQSTVNGLSTYRSYNQLSKARQAFTETQDKATRSALAFIFCNRWIAFRLDFITMTIALTAALLVALFSSTLPPGMAGLVLTSALQCGGIFQYASRMLAETESHFTSVERLRAFEESTPLENSIAKGAGKLVLFCFVLFKRAIRVVVVMCSINCTPMQFNAHLLNKQTPRHAQMFFSLTQFVFML
jgi:ABC-type multidrug transport system fused ATPase/permease subunit